MDIIFSQKLNLSILNDTPYIPNHPLPAGYEFSLLTYEEQRHQWAEVTTAAGEFPHKTQALKRFAEEFTPHLTEAKKRILFLKTTNGSYAGTATAWVGEWDKQTIGRLHWMEIKPEFQGQKLGRPLIAKAFELLSNYHHKAYLKTQPRSLAAIHLYLEFGFTPAIQTTAQEVAWNYVFSQLNKD
ncbi:GNAT family N-acetyltransferase [Lentibacillus sediminis]|uniref:GNAT family N-acetyltransferase n=1 Tax=Lentibacillus sediminis TaxID=1940529 RepID=UPI001304627D|nr:GNAT family N-acetyltransferase [Lentibacillus sediminis]